MTLGNFDLLSEKYEHLKQHNQVYNDRLQKVLKSAHSCMLVQGTGTGKSYHIQQIIYDMCIEKWTGSDSIKVLLIVPYDTLGSEWEEQLGPKGAFRRSIKDLIREVASRTGSQSYELKTGEKCSYHFEIITYSRMKNIAGNKKEDDITPLTPVQENSLLSYVKQFNLVVFDEVHHALANTWYPCAEAIVNAASGNMYVLGVTATPGAKGENGLSNEKLFKGHIVKGPSVAQAQKGDYEVYKDVDKDTSTKRSGKQILPGTDRIVSIVFDTRLSACNNFRKKYETWISQYEKKTGDVRGASQCRQILDMLLKNLDVKTYAKYARSKLLPVKPQKLICFYPQGQSESQVKSFVKDIFGISKIVSMHSEFTDKENKEAKEDFKNSTEDIIILAVDKMGEGLHIKGVTGLILLRATFSSRLFQQWIGRLMSSDNVGNDMPIFDISSNFALIEDMKDGIPDDLREFLDSPKNKTEMDKNSLQARVMFKRIEDILSAVPEPRTKVAGDSKVRLASIIPQIHQYGNLYVSKNLDDVVALFNTFFQRKKAADPEYKWGVEVFKPVDYHRALLTTDKGDTKCHFLKILDNYVKDNGKFGSFSDLTEFLRTNFKFNAALPLLKKDFKKNYLWRNIVDNYDKEKTLIKDSLDLRTEAYLADVPLSLITELFS